MSAGKAAAQVGHGSMLLAAKMSFEDVKRWAARDFVLSVREIDAIICWNLDRLTRQPS